MSSIKSARVEDSSAIGLYNDSSTDAQFLPTWFDGAILKITRRQNLNRCITHAVMKHLRLLLLLLLLPLLLLMLLLLEGEVVLIIARKLLQSSTAAEEKLLRVC